MKLFASALLAVALAAAVSAPASAGDCPFAKDRSASTSDAGSQKTAQNSSTSSVTR